MNHLYEKILASEALDAAEKAELLQLDPEALQAANQQLTAQVAELQEGGDRLRAELAAVNRRQQVRDLAAECRCLDPDYFDFRADRAGIDLADAGAVAAFVAELRQRSPGCFAADLRPGSGQAEHKAAPAPAPAPDDRIGRIMNML